MGPLGEDESLVIGARPGPPGALCDLSGDALGRLDAPNIGGSRYLTVLFAGDAPLKGPFWVAFEPTIQPLIRRLSVGAFETIDEEIQRRYDHERHFYPLTFPNGETGLDEVCSMRTDGIPPFISSFPFRFSSLLHCCM